MKTKTIIIRDEMNRIHTLNDLHWKISRILIISNKCELWFAYFCILSLYLHTLYPFFSKISYVKELIHLILVLVMFPILFCECSSLSKRRRFFQKCTWGTTIVVWFPMTSKDSWSNFFYLNLPALLGPDSTPTFFGLIKLPQLWVYWVEL